MSKGKSFQIDIEMLRKAFKLVKANHGAEGVDKVTVQEYETRLEGNLYKLWNRMSSGSYFPKAVRGVEIPKKAGGKRMLGIPTVEDRIAQMTARLSLEPQVEPIFCNDSYGYRPNKSAIDAIRVTRERCWKYDWLLEFDIRGLFDHIDHELLMKAVRKHMKSNWVILYIERWLIAPIQLPDGQLKERTCGTPQGGVISPVLANLFLHYVFDKWMQKVHPSNPWARYADDGVVHCRTRTEAEQFLTSLEKRMRECRLEIHPEKTRIVYCKDANRLGSHENTAFDFLGYTFRARIVRNKNGQFFACFGAAASIKSCASFRERMRDIRMNGIAYKLEELAQLMNPVIQGWANYFDQFHARTAKNELNQINLGLARWVMRHFKRYKGKFACALDFLGRCAASNPSLFAHWKMGCIPTT